MSSGGPSFNVVALKLSFTCTATEVLVCATQSHCQFVFIPYIKCSESSHSLKDCLRPFTSFLVIYLLIYSFF